MVAPPAPAQPKKKLTRNQIKRERKKQKRETSRSSSVAPSDTETENESDASVQTKNTSLPSDSVPDIEISDLDYDENDPAFAEFREIMEKFKVSSEIPGSGIEDKGELMMHDDDGIPDEAEDERDDEEPKLSKKKRKEKNKLSVAELKALVKRPEIVEWTDPSASDPRLLVHLKSYRNCVPVPSHWSLKREYLSSKRGIEKPPFELPSFIKATGIMEMRDAVREKEEAQTLKAKMRERVQGKTGKLDIDYQKLHDAFFRFQTKPPLTTFGEVYYEGKEFETNLKDRRPGDLSDELKEALNMPPGAPPPWLINMQRFGPPPAYPSLKIPGLNAPIPAGAQWGFHPGGYGKPPVDEFNRPLYGDVFGVTPVQPPPQTGVPVEKTLWGELQELEEESEEEEESEDEDEEEAPAGRSTQEDIASGLATPGGLETPSGFASVAPSEIELGEFDLRKQRHGTDTEEPRSLYTVLPEQQIRSKGFFGGQHAYDLNAARHRDPNIPVLGTEDRKRKKPGDVEVALDPETIEHGGGDMNEEVKKRYEASLEEKRREREGFQEDLTDMIAEENRKRRKREDERKGGGGGDRGDRRKEKYRF
ncbi:DUF382-domain-containing protein [Ascobolus immersus RN42]|uniref:DUF382-domain-containing protein n=1 Tax=Ascobolus immersus RN42 TaxID=1160509 RepID=A0A3N4IF01_ASCIM|nr:DUF382-domain-containing protein [Ascobolus immersus RN42]